MASQRMTREDRERLFAAARKFDARWRQIGGEWRLALYRATCGAPDCAGHLGDLIYITADGVLASWAMIRARHEGAAKLREEIQCIAAAPAAYPRGEFRGWHLHPGRMDLKHTLRSEGERDDSHAIYSGFLDTGLRVNLQAGKRSSHGTAVGRRDVAFDRPRRYGESREVIGEEARPGDYIWCPIRACGAVNYVDWPDGLKDPAAR